MKKDELIQRVKGVPSYVKTHWSTPNEGEFLSISEVVAYTATQAGSYIFMTFAGIMTFAGTYFCGAIMGIAAMDFYMINLIGTVLGYVLMFANPFGVLIYENHGRLTGKTRISALVTYWAYLVVGIAFYFIPSTQFEFIMKGFPQIVGNSLVVSGISSLLNWYVRKKFCAKHGRLKPFVLLFGFPSAILMSVIPFLPVQNMTYTTKLVVLHFAFSLMNYFYQSFVNVNGLVTFMTPNSQERQRLYSIVPIVTGFFPSVINMFLPVLIASTGGYLNIRTYKIFVPVFCFVGAFVTLAVAKCKERIIEPPMEKRESVKFWRGAKNVLKNKYFWIKYVSDIVGQWMYLISSLLSWWFIYSLRMEWFSGIAASIVVVGMTAGNIICPILTKRYQKRDILIGARGVTLITILGVALAVKLGNIYLFMISLFLRNTLEPLIGGLTGGLQADILDYHQWKYGERADAMCGVFTWILNPVSLLFGYIIPWLLQNVGFTSDWDVLFDSKILTDVFNIHTWATFAGLVLATIPYFFYDLTKEKHDLCIKELQERVRAIENAEECAAEEVQA